jgi:hypothetical protein
MELKTSDRGFRRIEHKKYTEPDQAVIVAESSAIGDYDDSFENPGSSYLWVGDCHLNREEVRILANSMLNWLANKRLEISDRH